MKKRILSIVLILVMAVGFLPTVTVAASAFSGGSGTEADPYLISTKSDLNNVRNYLSAHFKMVNDIEFDDADFEYGGAYYNRGELFTPIGTSSSAFTGTFDGNGYVIKNIKIKYLKSVGSVGLFGYNNGTVKNLGIVDSYIEANANATIYLGAIAGVNAGTVSNCYNASYLRGTSVGYKANSTMGGIVGYNTGTVEKCYNTGKLVMIAGFYQGGIVGTVAGGTVTNCYNKGEVYTAAIESRVGGIAGYLSEGTISDCYNVGEIGFETNIVMGGIVGLSNGAVIRCYDECYLHNAGEVNNFTSGAIIGKTKDKSEIHDCYYLNWMGGFGQSPDGATEIEWNQEGEQSSYVNFDFENVWMFDKSVQKTPMLRAFHTHKFDDVCDADCDSCGDVREAPHSYGNYISDNNATTDADGTKTRVCSVCGNKDTATDVGSKLPPPTPTPQPQPEPSVEIKDTSKIFTDIPAKIWYKEYVDYCVAYGIFDGTSATTFSPDNNITRAQFVQVLANITGVDTSNRNVATEFADVPAKKWYTAAIKWASENGIVSGMGGGRFAPNDNVTREQMCLMLTKYAQFREIELKAVEDKAAFADDSKISKWAKAAVYTCKAADIVNGKGENIFDPQGTGKRSEACVIFTKFHKDYLA